MTTVLANNKTEELVTGGNLLKWQLNYVRQHVEAGHCGLCFAWLDTAFCPLENILGRCQFEHSCPASWSSTKKSKHDRMLRKMEELWTDEINVGDANVTESFVAKRRRRYSEAEGPLDVAT